MRVLSLTKARWCCQMITLVVLTLTALIQLIKLLPNKEQTYSTFRDASLMFTNEKEIWSRLRFEPGHTKAHGELCAANPRLVILVMSAPKRSEARDAIRATWGRTARRANIPMAFVLGVIPNHLLDALNAEDAQHKDLIVGRFLDSYMNLTLKSLSILEWITNYCPATARVLKTDDDMFVNVDRILAFIEAPERINATNTIWGEIVRNATPMRDERFKYYVPLQEYPEPLYPPFAVGHGYLMSADAAPLILHAARDASFLRLEDVFVTGVLAELAGIRREHVEEFFTRPTEDACDVRRLMLVHDMRFHEQFDRYAKLLNPDIACPE